MSYGVYNYTLFSREFVTVMLLDAVSSMGWNALSILKILENAYIPPDIKDDDHVAWLKIYENVSS